MNVNEDVMSILAQPKDTELINSPDTLSRNYGVSLEKAKKIAEILKSPRPDILSDFPTNIDLLNFNTLVRTISNVVLSESTQTPLTICIDGEWGSGKTSILKMIEAQARMLNFACIWVNAWNLNNLQDMTSTINNEILREFELQGDPDEDSNKENLRTYLWQWAKSPTNFSKVVETLLQESGKDESRLIVFIDDIDRAFPEQILMMLKSLKLILESSNCIFILAMDVDVVAQSLAKAYIKQNLANSNAIISINSSDGSSVTIDQLTNTVSFPDGEDKLTKDFGYKYLEKLIQIQLKVPRLTRKIIRDYLQQLNIIDEVIEIINMAPDNEILNPRRLKQYINWLSISLQLIIALPISSTVSNLTALRTLALRYDYPDVYDQIIESDNVYEVLNHYPHLKFLLDYGSFVRGIREFDNFLSEIPMLNVKRRQS
ncbi:KAP family P-loop NTPase fold protein [Nostoc sp. CALU 1950]|uniref:KAP family P-loop NTPase fold protein n=1 Tax=Nostoc sp. CALU 1950 TaxID=3104321 RepID=UPI003EC00453